MIYKVENRESIDGLYKNQEETLILTYLEGFLGEAYVTQMENPTSAVIKIADFSLFAGEVSEELLKYSIQEPSNLVFPTSDWDTLVEEICPTANKRSRWAMKIDTIDKEKLQDIVNSLDPQYQMREIQEEDYQRLIQEAWAMDLCTNFKDYADFINKGMGVIILHQGKIVSRVSSYTVFNGGIEIQIDTIKEYRRKGLALICAAKLMLMCLQRGIYPSWDAHNLGSVALSKKLGYVLNKEYTVYEIV